MVSSFDCQFAKAKPHENLQQAATIFSDDFIDIRPCFLSEDKNATSFDNVVMVCDLYALF